MSPPDPRHGVPADESPRWLRPDRLAEHLATAAGREDLTGGLPLVVLDLRDGAQAHPMSAWRALRHLPVVVLAVCPADADAATADLAALVDLALTPEPPASPRPAAPVTPAGGVEAAVARLAEAVAARPLAAVALAVLLRGAGGGGSADRLVAESTTYGLLQAGPEHAAWLRGPRHAGAPEPNCERLRLSRHGDVLRVVLHRPARRNAVDAAMRDALCEALALLEVDPRLRAVITADGPAFCSGGDLAEFGRRSDPVTAHLLRLTRSPAMLLARYSDRVEVRLHGACYGAGIELPAFAGRVLATPDAVFCLPELTLGLIPGAGGTVSIPARIGRQRAAWLALTGEVIDAPTALAWGLVDEVGPGGDRGPAC